VALHEREHAIEVIVPDGQLSLAIGKDGQNVRLASRLTGWQIELVSSRDLEQRERFQEQLMMPIGEMVGVTEKMAERLKAAGVNTVQKLIKKSRDELLKIPGFGPKSVDKLMATAEGTVKELEAALEELIRKENEEREKEQKEKEKPLFDESVMEAEPAAEPAAPEPELTEETLFKESTEVEDEEPPAPVESEEEELAAAADESSGTEITEEAEEAEEAEKPVDAMSDVEESATPQEEEPADPEAEADKKDPA